MPKILLVEDDPVQIELIRKHLESFGYSLVIARNGQEGIKAAQVEKPDLILMDMIMPGMHGLEAVIKLKESPLTMNIPIIALTIMSSPKFVQECYRAGIIGYIKKPYEPKALLESVERVVGKPERKINKILIIAGASRLATMIEMRLVRQGYQVESFAGGKTALSHVEKEKPDAIFLDITLPAKHVSAVFEAMKKSERMQEIPVILLSPQGSDEELKREAASRGAAGYITSASDLADMLQNLNKPAA
ncbi:MAG: response regulator [Candidatus Aminicenantes bacterium]|nr:response regulator [Candidatus Aminicenantes bacterium]